MSEWIECDNVTALQKKMEGFEVQWSSENTYVWHLQKNYDFQPFNHPNGVKYKYRYRSKPEFKEGDKVLKWWGDADFSVFNWMSNTDIEVAKSLNAKIIPYHGEVIKACVPDNPLQVGSDIFFPDMKMPSTVIANMLKPGERGRFLIMRIPEADK